MATYDVEFFNSISSSREIPRNESYGGFSTAQLPQRGSSTPHYSFTPPQYYARASTWEGGDAATAAAEADEEAAGSKNGTESTDRRGSVTYCSTLKIRQE